MSSQTSPYSHLEIPGVVRLANTPSGFIKITVTSPQAEAVIYNYGAHIASFQPTGKAPVLFMSATSRWEAGEPLRGGVPVIFPWFGLPADKSMPLHGFARTQFWDVHSVEQNGAAVEIDLRLTDSAETQRIWPHAFQLRLLVRVGAELSVSLEVTNRDVAAIRFENGLHTYFQVGDVRKIRIRGLERTRFLDRLDGGQEKCEDGVPVGISGETDRLYLATESACTIEDPALGRSLEVTKSGSRNTVLWNPWIAKAGRMPDFGDHEWPSMVCVEAVNAGSDAVVLAPGATHRLAAVFRTT